MNREPSLTQWAFQGLIYHVSDMPALSKSSVRLGNAPCYCKRENPRLCRGDSRSLTFTEIASGFVLTI